MANKIKAYGVCVYRKVNNQYEILLCKSVMSRDKWGFLKGVVIGNEGIEDTALREFEEESSIQINKKYFEEFFIQENESKDIGIYLLNANNIKSLDTYFTNNSLKNNYLSWENSKVEFFNLNKLPSIKSKQTVILNCIFEVLVNKA